MLRDIWIERMVSGRLTLVVFGTQTWRTFNEPENKQSDNVVHPELFLTYQRLIYAGTRRSSRSEQRRSVLSGRTSTVQCASTQQFEQLESEQGQLKEAKKIVKPTRRRRHYPNRRRNEVCYSTGRYVAEWRAQVTSIFALAISSDQKSLEMEA